MLKITTAPQQSSARSPAERRRSPRVELSYQMQIEHGGRSYWVRAINLGVGGAFIETDAPLRGGSMLTLSLNTLEAGSSTRARVCSGNGSGFGVAFIDPPDMFQQQIDALLAPLLRAGETAGDGDGV